MEIDARIAFKQRSLPAQTLMPAVQSGIWQLVVFALLSICVLALPNPARASTEDAAVSAYLAEPAQIGTAETKLLGFRLFRAELYTEKGRMFDWNQRFSLRLVYDRAFDANALVWASMFELSRLEGDQADHAAIEEKLASCYRDVTRGDAFVTIAEGPDHVRFLLNGAPTCVLWHDGIRDRLLGIWLSDGSRDVAASRALRGMR